MVEVRKHSSSPDEADQSRNKQHFLSGTTASLTLLLLAVSNGTPTTFWYSKVSQAPMVKTLVTGIQLGLESQPR